MKIEICWNLNNYVLYKIINCWNRINFPRKQIRPQRFISGSIRVRIQYSYVNEELCTNFSSGKKKNYHQSIIRLFWIYRICTPSVCLSMKWIQLLIENAGKKSLSDFQCFQFSVSINNSLKWIIKKIIWVSNSELYRIDWIRDPFRSNKHKILCLILMVP